MGSSIATLGAASLAQLGVSSLLAAETNKTLGFAFVGLGDFAQNHLLPGITRCKFCKPVALVSGHPEKAAAVASKYGIDSRNIYNYENYDSIRDNPVIDVVYVVLPNGMHAEYTIRAFAAGKHVMCEKPMANTAEECRADDRCGPRRRGKDCRSGIGCTGMRRRWRASRHFAGARSGRSRSSRRRRDLPSGIRRNGG